MRFKQKVSFRVRKECREGALMGGIREGWTPKKELFMKMYRVSCVPTNHCTENGFVNLYKLGSILFT